MDYLSGAELQLKDGHEDEEGHFEGFAAIFNKVDRGHDVILPGAFDKTLHRRKPRKIKMLHQHDPRNIIGVWDEFTIEKKGLFAKGHLLLEIPAAKQTHLLMKAGALDSLSIGFMTIDDSFDRDNHARILKEVDLLEVSTVAIPMQEDAIITVVKGLGPDELETKIDLERALRKAGFSRSTAKYVCSGWTPPARRNGEGVNDLLGAFRSLTASIKPV